MNEHPEVDLMTLRMVDFLNASNMEFLKNIFVLAAFMPNIMINNKCDNLQKFAPKPTWWKSSDGALVTGVL